MLQYSGVCWGEVNDHGKHVRNDDGNKNKT